MEAVVAAKSSQGAKSDGIWEENLSAGINPHLSETEVWVKFHSLLSCVSLMLMH